MRIIYLDSNFCCHLINDGTMIPIETDVFDNKCQTYIEGYRFIPEGSIWIREDGMVFYGEMISPAEDYSRLKKAQQQYELDQVQQWSNLAIKQEENFTATQNYSKDEYLSIYGQVYKTIAAIPKNCSIVINQNIVSSTIQEYLDSLKED